MYSSQDNCRAVLSMPTFDGWSQRWVVNGGGVARNNSSARSSSKNWALLFYRGWRSAGGTGRWVLPCSGGFWTRVRVARPGGPGELR